MQFVTAFCLLLFGSYRNDRYEARNQSGVTSPEGGKRPMHPFTIVRQHVDLGLPPKNPNLLTQFQNTPRGGVGLRDHFCIVQ